MAKRPTQDVQLPTFHSQASSHHSQSRPAMSMASGSGRYKAGVVAHAKVPRCPRHKNCNYTGRERGRCPVCHAFTDEEGCLGHESYPAGRTRPCLCTQCDELFSSPSAFGTHQKLIPEERGGGVRCYDPARRGLVLLDKNGWMMWCAPGERPELDYT